MQWFLRKILFFYIFVEIFIPLQPKNNSKSKGIKHQVFSRIFEISAELENEKNAKLFDNLNFWQKLEDLTRCLRWSFKCFKVISDSDKLLYVMCYVYFTCITWFWIDYKPCLGISIAYFHCHFVLLTKKIEFILVI